ncbi:MAG: 4Fe-4S dicluster domain-containing protein [Desulfobacterales bacterium]|nr:4Fe-4S dicluster domain-containing protein [Desulfobacterales bacterium]MDD4072271.1 4Fe-4S dicluster domain-containing protein [Desulfobacterales bacterium]MDD4392808.1 4Fe-4S dicluster domain-containing protein [Desulfobacterales bacterium]
MPGDISRRAFLKGSLTSACMLAASQVPAGAAITDGTEQLATLIDISKCVGCGACVEACKDMNSPKFPRPEKPFPKMVPARVPVEDWSEKQEVTDRLTPYNWLFIQHATVRVNGEETELTIPRRCMHCVNPPCVKLCPWGAARQLENGISVIDSDLCLGGSKCKKVCPWQIPNRQTGVGLYLDLLPAFAGNGVMYKCDRCYDRISKGELPACIEACPEGVQTIGPREEIIEAARKQAKQINGYVYGETENGGTNTLYVSPIPFEEIDKALETGKGKPHLKPVENSMGQANALVAAMALAPIAGIAAAAGKLYHRVKTEKQGESDASR